MDLQGRIGWKKRFPNPLYLRPEEDFDFSTEDSVFFGYVKAVDDLSRVDVETVKVESAAFETLVYADEYFESSVGGGGCCR